MQKEKKLVIQYWSKTNAFYQAKLINTYSVSTILQEEAKKMIDSTSWIDVQNKHVSVNNSPMIEKTYYF